LVFSIYGIHDNLYRSIIFIIGWPAGHWPLYHKIRHNDKLARGMEKAANNVIHDYLFFRIFSLSFDRLQGQT